MSTDYWRKAQESNLNLSDAPGSSGAKLHNLFTFHVVDQMGNAPTKSCVQGISPSLWQARIDVKSKISYVHNMFKNLIEAIHSALESAQSGSTPEKFQNSGIFTSKWADDGWKKAGVKRINKARRRQDKKASDSAED